MKKLLVYPFNKETCPLVRYRKMLREYELVAAVPEKGYGWEGKDVCELDGGEPTGFVLSESLSREMERCDAVFLNVYNQKYSEVEASEYKSIVQGFSKELLTPTTDIITETGEELQPDTKLKAITVPVIMVMGLGENCQKFDIQLGLRDTFIKAGYKVLQFGTKSYSSLFGFDAIPKAPEVPLWKKVYLYNKLFWGKCESEKPDVIVIGVPGGVMPISSVFHEMFGETALSLAFAARPDISLLSYYFTLPTQKYFDLHKKFMRFRFCAGNLFFHASNTNHILDNDMGRQSYLTLKSEAVLEKLSQHDKSLSSQLFNSLIQQSSVEAYRNVVQKLQSNICLL